MKNLKVRPLDDRVVVEPVEAEERTAGGIVLPDTAKEKPQRGTVLSVGPGKLLENGHRGELSVAVGDVVIYGKYAGTDIEINGHDVKILRESDILAKVTAERKAVGMKTFQEYLSSAAHEGTVNVLFEAGMYSLLDDLERIVNLLRQAGVSFEVIGGMAVNAHLLAARERSRTFVTRDIDLLVRRDDLSKIVAAAEAGGYQAKIVGGHMLIRPSQQPAEAVHLVFSGERSKSIHPLPHPPIRPEEKQLFELIVPVAPLSDLVRMKLNSLRPKDLVHLETLDDAGLIDAEIEADLPPVLSERLSEARKQFERDEPDVEE